MIKRKYIIPELGVLEEFLEAANRTIDVLLRSSHRKENQIERSSRD